MGYPFPAPGLAWGITGDLDLIIQYMNGETGMGMVTQPRITGVVNDFEAFFILLVKRFGKHQFTVRYDDFSVDDRDNTSFDHNNERGHAWTLAYFWDVRPNLRFGLEWLEVDSNRMARNYLGQAAAKQDSHFQAGIRWRFNAGAR